MYSVGKVILIGAALMMLVAAGVQAQAPNTLMYQGKLSNEVGPITSAVNVTFRIYDLDEGGVVLWTETQSITPNEVGVFTAELGSVTPFGPGVFDGSVRYLGIEVAGDGEMVPRQPITSVPYALGAPGVAYNYLDEYDVTDAVTAPLSVTVQVSQPGYVVLEANGWAMMGPNTTTAAWMAIAIGGDPAILNPVSLQWLWEAPNPSSYIGLESFSVRNVVAVVPGDYTYYVTVQAANPLPCTIINTFLSATVIPTWLGTAPPPLLTTSSKMNPERLDELKTTLMNNLNQTKQ